MRGKKLDKGNKWKLKYQCLKPSKKITYENNMKRKQNDKRQEHILKNKEKESKEI